jgi:hypothetical protein
MLRYGASTNWAKFRERMILVSMEKYGDLARMIELGEYYMPPEYEIEDYDLEDDPFGLNLLELKEDRKSRKAIISKMLANTAAFYATIYAKLSPESLDEVKKDEDYDDFHTIKSPLGLWLCAERIHKVATASRVEAVIKATARATYQNCKQGTYETIIPYKERFSEALKSYEDTGNPEMEEADIAMDMFNGLDDTRYAEFKVSMLNDINKGSIDQPATLNEMYHLAAQHLTARKAVRGGGNAVFMTSTDRCTQQGNDKRKGGMGTQSSSAVPEATSAKASVDKYLTKHGEKKQGKKKDEKQARDLSDITCYGCGEKGHYARDCPEGDEAACNATWSEEDDEASCNATWSVFMTDGTEEESSDDDKVPDLASDSESDSDDSGDDLDQPKAQHVPTGNNMLGKHEVLLDPQANVSIMHPDFLSDIRKVNRRVNAKGVASGQPGLSLDSVGTLRDFFECKSCTSGEASANILCYADVEDKYDITVIPRQAFIVHLPGRDLHFIRRDKLYVGDMSEWLQSDTMANVTTIQGNESKYTVGEVKRARTAQQMIINSGYPSEKEAVHLVNDGNVRNVPVTAQDVRRAFDIYGRSAQAVRGKATKKKVSRASVDESMRDGRKSQIMYTDIMNVRKQPYMLSLVEPLELILVSKLDGTKSEQCGKALQDQMNVIRGRGFVPVTAYLDPQPGFTPLVGQFPGVEIDISGAGDHLDKVDAKIRRVKETIRSVHASLPWNLPDSRVQDLVKYAVTRLNMRRTFSKVSNVAPRVAFTGIRPNYKKEFELSFGEYVESYDITCKSNDAEQNRSQPCIAMYSAGNGNGSWVLLNIRTNNYVTRSTWEKMVTTDLVIARMNELASHGKPNREVMPMFDDDTPLPVPPPMELTTPALPSPTMVEPAHSSHIHTADTAETTQVETETVQGDTVQQDAHEELGVNHCRVAESTINLQTCRFIAGVRHRPIRHSVVKVFATNISVKRALKEHGKEAHTAIMAELRQLLITKKAMHLVDRKNLSVRQLKKVIRSSMFLKSKFDAVGRFEKIKARLVADGRGQDRALYPDTSSPTVAVQSLMMCLVLAAMEHRKAAKIDIGGAYLNAEMVGEEVIMELDETLSMIVSTIVPDAQQYMERGRLWVKLDKALYGCVQSAKLWYEKLTGVLRDMGFTHNAVDKCVMNQTINGKQCTLVIYVDDILVLSQDDASLEYVIGGLKGAFKEVTTEKSDDFSYLGMRIRFLDHTVIVTMDGFVEDVITEYDTTGVRSTPATSELFETNGDLQEICKMRKVKFHTLVAKLLYLSKRVRPDIQVAVMYLCTRVRCPNEQDIKKLERVMQYINGTKEFGLTLKCDGPLRIIGFIDAAYGCHVDGKSHSGAVVQLCGCCVMAISRKQKIVSKSSTEAELIALSDLCSIVELCNDFMNEQGYDDADVPLIWQDNQSTISMVKTGGGATRTKHLRVRQNLVRERIENGNIVVEYMPTLGMIADVLTKPLQGALFRGLSGRVLGSQNERSEFVNERSEAERGRERVLGSQL